MTRRISIFGATGSIGQNTLDVIRGLPDGAAEVVVLSGGRNVRQLAEDAVRMRAELAVTAFDECYDELAARLSGTGIAAAAGEAAVLEAADRPADWIMSAIVGLAGLKPGLASLRHGTTLALANKESLVAGGPLMMETARRYGARVLPVDSEHSAIFQALTGEDISTVERIVLTASGGAFRDWSLDRLRSATLAEASCHPNWTMGQRITIDSASMFNKAMEIIETKEFFGIAPDRIEVLIHPESLVHSLVGFADGALMAHIGPPDMRHAIGYAWHYPGRGALPVERLDLARIGALTFRNPDPARYPALGLARQVMAAGGLAGAVFTAAKDAALDAFIAGRARFTQMAELVEGALERYQGSDVAGMTRIGLENIQIADNLSRESVLAQLRETAHQG